jgi:hypothetical protein
MMERSIAVTHRSSGDPVSPRAHAGEALVNAALAQIRIGNDDARRARRALVRLGTHANSASMLVCPCDGQQRRAQGRPVRKGDRARASVPRRDVRGQRKGLIARERGRRAIVQRVRARYRRSARRPPALKKAHGFLAEPRLPREPVDRGIGAPSSKSMPT